MSHYHRILLVPYPVQGHINPAFEFAKRLIALGAHVTLSTTLHMHNRITNKPIIPNLSYLPFSDGYDDGFKGTGNDEYLLYSAEFRRRGSEFVANLILTNSQQGTPFTCLVHSLLLQWAAKTAREFHLPTALLWVQPATVFNILYHYFHGYSESIKNPSSSIELPGLPLLLSSRDIPSFLLDSSPSVYALMASLFEEQFNELDVDIETNPTTILVNSFEELEPEALRAVEKLNMISIGPLISYEFLDGKDPSKDNSFGGQTHIFQPSNDCVEWLDTMKETSVIYVSFGSYFVLSKRQTEEIAQDVWKIGVRVDDRVNDDGVVGGDEIKRCLEVVTGSGEKGKELRKNANKWKRLAREAVKEGGSSEKNLRGFLDGVAR
ncbi:hypothetical protein TSUD_81350 [Trifolium subterraneum]|uniref:Uncharacterized protein n=1 Tax=Trifolium subterraneum TaxID=3900 RepID=A0A2Z6PEU3_TRISU|nr:hypothetical protein TSUD_81350 [Trifolium subterraneum]